MPIIRTLIPTLAGTIHMNPRTFMISNAIGAVLWGAGVPTAGLLLGKLIPKEVLDKYILVIVGIVLVASFIPVLLEVNKRRRRT